MENFVGNKFEMKKKWVDLASAEQSIDEKWSIGKRNVGKVPGAEA